MAADVAAAVAEVQSLTSRLAAPGSMTQAEALKFYREVATIGEVSADALREEIGEEDEG